VAPARVAAQRKKRAFRLALWNHERIHLANVIITLLEQILRGKACETGGCDDVCLNAAQNIPMLVW